jgi:hypothetical protein
VLDSCRTTARKTTNRRRLRKRSSTTYRVLQSAPVGACSRGEVKKVCLLLSGVILKLICITVKRIALSASLCAVLRQSQVALNQLAFQQYRRKNREPCSASSWVCLGWFGSSQKVIVHTQFRCVSLASAAVHFEVVFPRWTTFPGDRPPPMEFQFSGRDPRDRGLPSSKPLHAGLVELLFPRCGKSTPAC